MMQNQITSVLAMDPGLRTGMAFWAPGEWRAIIVDPEDAMDELDMWSNANGPGAALVVESFRITPETGKKGSADGSIYWPLQLNGIARFLARRNRLLYAEQTPADAKNFVPDERLRDVGMWSPGKEDHHRDATRHLVRFLARKRIIRVPPLEV